MKTKLHNVNFSINGAPSTRSLARGPPVSWSGGWSIISPSAQPVVAVSVGHLARTVGRFQHQRDGQCGHSVPMSVAWPVHVSKHTYRWLCDVLPIGWPRRLCDALLVGRLVACALIALRRLAPHSASAARHRIPAVAGWRPHRRRGTHGGAADRRRRDRRRRGLRGPAAIRGGATALLTTGQPHRPYSPSRESHCSCAIVRPSSLRHSRDL